jgi:hypothetical protein
MIKRARRCVLLSTALAEAGARRTVDLDGGQRLQILDTLIASLTGAYAHLPAKRAAYASDPVEAWSQSLQDAVPTGELYVQPLPLTDPTWCNDKGRKKYPGPSVAVRDDQEGPDAQQQGPARVLNPPAA